MSNVIPFSGPGKRTSAANMELVILWLKAQLSGLEQELSRSDLDCSKEVRERLELAQSQLELALTKLAKSLPSLP